MQLVVRQQQLLFRITSFRLLSTCLRMLCHLRFIMRNTMGGKQFFFFNLAYILFFFFARQHQ